MPLYEYQCKACQHVFEVMQKMSDKPPSKCPVCQSKKVDKLISKSGFQLKGSGWYVTDYKKPSQEAKTSTQEKPEKQDKPAEKITEKKEKTVSKKEGKAGES